MAGEVFTSTIAEALKETLDGIADDKLDGYESKAVMPKFCSVQKMEDHWVDEMEMGGPGLASEKSEGGHIATGSIKEGYITRYLSRTFGLKMIITEEAMEDNKYPKVIRAAMRLKRAMVKTYDVDATNILVRGFNTAYVGGDGQPLWSASHTLPHGGTFSNVMAVPMSPSRQAVISAATQARKMVGHDGLVEGYELKKIVAPTEQWAVWRVILGSSKAPEAGEYNAINVVNTDLDIELVTNKYWSNTSTNYAFMTDCDEMGISFRWRRKPRSRSWVDNDQEVMKFSITARWARGWTDPRCTIGVNA